MNSRCGLPLQLNKVAAYWRVRCKWIIRCGEVCVRNAKRPSRVAAPTLETRSRQCTLPVRQRESSAARGSRRATGPCRTRRMRSTARGDRQPLRRRHTPSLLTKSYHLPLLTRSASTAARRFSGERLCQPSSIIVTLNRARCKRLWLASSLSVDHS